MSIFKQKKGLGRGLSSLIGDTKSSSVKNKISISEIVRGKFQPRKIFSKEGLEELSNSIREEIPLPNPFFCLNILRQRSP